MAKTVRQPQPRPLENVRRTVVKLGTRTLCDPDGTPDHLLLDSLARDVAHLRKTGHQFLFISSGAIGLGRSVLRLPDPPEEVAGRQALSAVGQPRLMAAWDAAFRRHRLPVAQLLLTQDDFEARRRYDRLMPGLESVLQHGAVPIINANDAVSASEIGEDFGDNDRLAGLFGARCGADLCILLSDVAGLHDRDPHRDGAQLLDHVPHIDDAVLRRAGVRPGTPPRDGMGRKLQTAQQLTDSGVHVAISYAREPGILGRLLAGETLGTWFDAVGPDRPQRLRTAAPAGRIHIDDGAAEALREGYQLLPAGVVEVEGSWPVESLVEIVLDDEVLARAVCPLAARDVVACIGLHSDDVRRVLGLERTVHVTRKGRVELLA